MRAPTPSKTTSHEPTPRGPARRTQRALRLALCAALLFAGGVLLCAPRASASAGVAPSHDRARFSRPFFTPVAPFLTRTYPVGADPRDIATGLFNGNSNGADLATVNLDGDNVSALLNNGNGTFGAARNFGVGDGPLRLAVGDFNGFGRRDIAVANYNLDTVGVLVCRGDGTFLPVRHYAAGDAPHAIETGDFNRDGRRDIVVTNRGAVPGMSILLGNGDGTFQPGRFYADYLDSQFVLAVHLNGDGKLDLVRSNSYSLTVHLGNGDGTFQAPAYFYGGGYLVSDAAAGDVNGDGRQDVVTADNYNGYSGVFLGNGDGTLQAPQFFFAGSNGTSVALADLNNDGRLDAVVTVREVYSPPGSYDSNTVSVLFGNGDGTFRARRSYPVNSSYPVRSAIADYNRDGWRDIAVVNAFGHNVTVLLNNGNGTF